MADGSQDVTNRFAALADRIEVHLTLDHSPGYRLSDEDQRTIVEALRLAAKCTDR